MTSTIYPIHPGDLTAPQRSALAQYLSNYGVEITPTPEDTSTVAVIDLGGLVSHAQENLAGYIDGYLDACRPARRTQKRDDVGWED